MKKTVFSLLIVFLASCSMPETRIYSLHLPNPSSHKGMTGAKVSDTSVAVSVDSPRYLTQPYIAYRNSPYQLSISRYSKWDSAPDEIVKEAFRDSLSSTGLFRDVRTSNSISSEVYSLKISLKRFERSDEGEISFGEVAFDAGLISPDGKSLYLGAVTKKVRLEDRSFLSLAKALSAALGEGTEEVRGNVEKALGRR